MATESYTTSMDVTFGSVCEHIQAHVASGIDMFARLAEWTFDEDTSMRGAISEHICLTSPNDDTPCVYFDN